MEPAVSSCGLFVFKCIQKDLLKIHAVSLSIPLSGTLPSVTSTG